MNGGQYENVEVLDTCNNSSHIYGAFVTKVDADQSGTRLRATLKGFNETPAVSTPATGTLRAIIREDQSSITFELSYSGLVADSPFARIHLGQKNVAGGVMIFFCDNRKDDKSD